MRRFLWMIMLGSVIALGSTVAHADTLVTNGGGFVTGIDGITLNGTLYNVTFTHTVDNTFSAFDSNSSTLVGVVNDINSDLGTSSILDAVGGFYIIGAASFGAIGAVQLVPMGIPPSPAIWVLQGLGNPGIDRDVASTNNENIFWANFTPAVVATPEPGALVLTLPGIGLLGLMVVMRKRKGPGFSQAT